RPAVRFRALFGSPASVSIEIGIRPFLLCLPLRPHAAADDNNHQYSPVQPTVKFRAARRRARHKPRETSLRVAQMSNCPLGFANTSESRHPWRYNDSTKMLCAAEQQAPNLLSRGEKVTVALVRALHRLRVWPRVDLPYA